MTAILKRRNARELLAAHACQGRPHGRLTGGWIDDLAALGKCVWLCSDCAPKFNSSHYGFVQKKDLPFVRGNCDGCRRFNDRNHMFVPWERSKRS